MSEHILQSEFEKVKTPEEQRELRERIEALHEKTHGKSPLSEQSQAIHKALGGRNDKDTVLQVMAEVLGIEPVEKDGVYWIGNWEVSFDRDNILRDMSGSFGGSGIIQSDKKNPGDT